MTRTRATSPRPCHRCWEVKPADAFPVGSQSRSKGDRRNAQIRYQKRSSVCQDCWAKEEREKWDRMESHIRTFEQEGVTVRRCSGCGEVKPLAESFYVCKRYPDGTVSEYHYRCKPCEIARGRVVRQKAVARDPKAARAKRAEAAKRWRDANPEKIREQTRRYREAISRDPERRARLAETARINYHLRREREGHDATAPVQHDGHFKHFRSGRIFDAAPASERVPHPRTGEPSIRVWCPSFTAKARPLPRNVLRPNGGPIPRLPAAPLGEAIERQFARQNGNGHALDRESYAQMLGTSARTLSAWKGSERSTVQYATADMILTRAGLHWWEVWSPEEYPQVAAALG